MNLNAVPLATFRTSRGPLLHLRLRAQPGRQGAPHGGAPGSAPPRHLPGQPRTLYARSSHPILFQACGSDGSATMDVATMS